MEDIRLLLQEEGRTARNLVAFHVPMHAGLTLPENGSVWSRKPPTVPRPVNDLKKQGIPRQGQRMTDASNPATRIRSASTGRDKKSEFQARYWAFLFGNLQRAVDEIYSTCESDESVAECKEAILVLENYTREFLSLIEWFQLKLDYENTAPPQRPTSLTWEVRKSSPPGKGKPRMTQGSNTDAAVLQDDMSTPRDSPVPIIVSPPPANLEAPVAKRPSPTVGKGSGDDTVEEKAKNSTAQSIVAEAGDMRDRDPLVAGKSEHSNTKTEPSEVVESVNFTAITKNVTEDINKSIELTSTDQSIDKTKVSNELHGSVPVPVCPEKPVIENTLPIDFSNSEVRSQSDLSDSKVPLQSVPIVPESQSTLPEAAKPANEDGTVPLMVSEASQTDLELCIEGDDGLRFLPPPGSLPLKPLVSAAKPVKTIPSPRKPQASPVTRNYAAVSRLSCPRTARVPAPTVTAQRPAPPPRSAVSHVEARVNHNQKMATARVRSSFPPQMAGRSLSSLSSSSWADKVKDKVKDRVREHAKDGASINKATVSVEVLPRTGIANQDDDQQGWETVKGRSRSRWSPSSTMKAKMRFNQVSASSSLPALALSDVEVCLPPPVIAKNKINMKTQQKKAPVQDIKKNKDKDNSREKMKAVTGKKPGTSELQDKENAVDMGVDENIDSSNVGDSVLDSKLEIFEDILEEELRKSRELSCEEAKLRREIQELETASDIELDAETEDEERERSTDDPTESVDGADADEEWLAAGDSDEMSLEARYEKVLVGMSWAERVDTLEQLQEYVARNPGRATELHQKLSSPSRRRTIAETLRRFQLKQAQAKEKRESLASQRAKRLKELHTKVEEVKAAQEANIEKRRLLLETKLKRAEANRRQHLKGIVRKAHDEEQKLKEIAFITELEAQNKRHDFMAQCQEQEDRLQGIAEERQRKQEEKAAKEAAVEERRRILEAERQERLERLQELRREREERVGRAQQEKEKERQELAREKARDREERLSALHAAQLATQEELQKKIQLKQEESARRHEENMEHIRQRALESSILRTDDVAPRLAPYQVQKLCEICGVLIGSEVYLLSHLRGRKHQEAVQKLHEGAAREEIAVLNIRHIVDAPADKLDPRLALDKKRQSGLKKRCKKIRQRMTARGQEFEDKHVVSNAADSANKPRLQKSLKDIDKLFRIQGKGQWPNTAITALERALGEMNRVLTKQGCSADQALFLTLNGFTTVNNILNLGLDVPPNMAPFIPSKCFVTACTTLSLACKGHPANATYLLLSNKISTILDLLLNRLTVVMPEIAGVNPTSLAVDPLGDALMRLLALVLSVAAPGDDLKTDAFNCRVQDVISYTVSVRVVDKLALYCGGVRDPIDGQAQAAQFLLSGIELLSTLTARCSVGGKSGGGRDPTQLLVTLQVTELVGAVSMLYGMLLHQGAPPRGTPPPPLPKHVTNVALATVNFLTRIAELDLDTFQSVLGAEGISLQFRHIASYLLWYCSHDRENDALLLAVVAVVGFFAVKHRDNQTMLQSGYMPTVLQQLCNLPLPYFVDLSLSATLFPTLLACCVDNSENKGIVQQEISFQSLEEFKSSDAAKTSSLMQLLPCS